MAVKPKTYSFSLKDVIPTAQQSTTRFVNGNYHIVLSEVESFEDYNSTQGRIYFKSGRDLFISRTAFNDFVTLMTS